METVATDVRQAAADQCGQSDEVLGRGEAAAPVGLRIDARRARVHIRRRSPESRGALPLSMRQTPRPRDRPRASGGAPWMPTTVTFSTARVDDHGLLGHHDLALTVGHDPAGAGHALAIDEDLRPRRGPWGSCRPRPRSRCRRRSRSASGSRWSAGPVASVVTVTFQRPGASTKRPEKLPSLTCQTQGVRLGGRLARALPRSRSRAPDGAFGGALDRHRRVVAPRAVPGRRDLEGGLTGDDHVDGAMLGRRPDGSAEPPGGPPGRSARVSGWVSGMPAPRPR